MNESVSDDRLLGALARALEAADPVPEHVVAAAREAILWQTIDAELAQLVYDSDREGMAGVRSAGTARQVTFQAPGLEIEVMLLPEGTRRLVGQLVPPQPAVVELQTETDTRQAGTDQLGRFSFTEVAAGPVKLVVTAESGHRVVTEWTVL